METDEAAAALAAVPRGAMQAPAGCGKTTLIAKAVARHTGGRDLILTHTHAGIDALRRKLRDFGAISKSYQLDTIAGWALRLASSFPVTAKLANPTPRTNEDYDAVYGGALALVSLTPIQRVLRASYSAVYVDEYQDCTLVQHNLMLALSRTLDCRVVGDPLQGIFSFRETIAVDWAQHVAPSFGELDGPTVGWRWNETNPALGEWLQDARRKLLSGEPVDLRGSPVKWVEATSGAAKGMSQMQACFAAARATGDTVVAIHHWAKQCHSVASKLKGLYSCVEPMEVGDLHSFALRFDNSSGLARAATVVAFASECMTRVKTELKTIRTAFDADRVPTVKKHSALLVTLLEVSTANGLQAIPSALDAISNIDGAVLYRAELFHEMKRAVRLCVDREVSSVAEAAWLVRSRTRHHGRRLPRCVVGTTLLVKGLQFDHAVVLDGDGYDAKNLYVALTRGAKSLTVVSQQTSLQIS